MKSTSKATFHRLGFLAVAIIGLPIVSELLIAPLLPLDAKVFIPVLFLFIVVAIVALAVWDGYEEGFNLLWIISPPLLFCIPAFTVYNSSALVYGLFYAGFGGLANALGFAIANTIKRNNSR